MLPVIWDADFFINGIDAMGAEKKYTLCEINVSSVSPFPPSAINFMVSAVKDRLNIVVCRTSKLLKPYFLTPMVAHCTFH